MITRESIKQFLKPTKKKIALAFILFILSFYLVPLEKVLQVDDFENAGTFLQKVYKAEYFVISFISIILMLPAKLYSFYVLKINIVPLAFFYPLFIIFYPKFNLENLTILSLLVYWYFLASACLLHVKFFEKYSKLTKIILIVLAVAFVIIIGVGYSLIANKIKCIENPWGQKDTCYFPSPTEGKYCEKDSDCDKGEYCVMVGIYDPRYGELSKPDPNKAFCYHYGNGCYTYVETQSLGGGIKSSFCNN